MTRQTILDLSRRERQIMHAVYRLGDATVAEVRAEIPDPPSYSAVRSTLSILEEKGLLTHRQDGPRHVYLPTVPEDEARESALAQLLGTFFDGSVEGAVAALLDMRSGTLSEEALDRLAEMVEMARREGR